MPGPPTFDGSPPPPGVPPPPGSAPPPVVGGLGSVGDWIGQSIRALTAGFGEIFAVIVVISLPAAAVSATLLRSAVQDLVLQRNSQGLFTGIEGFTPAAGWQLGLAVLVSVLAQILVFAAATNHVAAGLAEEPATWSQSLRVGLARAPRLVGVTLFLLGVAFVAIFLTSALSLAVPVAGPLFLLGLIGFFVLMWVRCSLAASHAALAQPGNSARVSVRLTKGLFWALFGRMILLITLVAAMQFVAAILAAPFDWAAGTPQISGTGDIAAPDLLGRNAGAFYAKQVVAGLANSLGFALWASAMLMVRRSTSQPRVDWAPN